MRGGVYCIFYTFATAQKLRTFLLLLYRFPEKTASRESGTGFHRREKARKTGETLFRAFFHFWLGYKLGYKPRFYKTIARKNPAFMRISGLFRVVGVTGFEPAASCSQSRRATNCATPRKGIWYHYTRRGREKSSFFHFPLAETKKLCYNSKALKKKCRRSSSVE